MMTSSIQSRTAVLDCLTQLTKKKALDWMPFIEYGGQLNL